MEMAYMRCMLLFLALIHVVQSAEVVRNTNTDTHLRTSVWRCCEQNTLTRHIFSCFTAHILMSYVTLAQGVLRALHPMCHPHGVVVLILFDSPLCTLHRLSHLPFHSPDLQLHLHLSCGLVRVEQIPCAFPRMRT